MNCDSIAKVYQWLEYFSFGPALWRCRMTWISQMSSAKHVLMIGEGDGRFLQAFLKYNSSASIDWIDNSSEMMKLAKRRLDPQQSGRVLFHHTDIRSWTASPQAYDLVVTHFFFDCFSNQDVHRLISNIKSSLTHDALWVISEFQYPKRRGWHWIGSTLIAGMYMCFQWMTQIEVSRLPHLSQAMCLQGFYCAKRREFLRGLLTAEVWASGACE